MNQATQIKMRLRGGFKKSLMIALTLLQIVPEIAIADFDYTQESYTLTFHPDEMTRIGVLNTEGQPLGHLPDDGMIQIQVTGDVVRNARGSNDEPDLIRILAQLPQVQVNGRAYLSMTFPYQLTTQEGSTLAPGSIAYLDVNSFRELAPSGATGTNNEVADEYNTALLERGYSGGARPSRRTARPPRRQRQVRTPVAPVPERDEHDHDDEEAQAQAESAPATRLRLGRGGPFPRQWLSAPLCGCARGSCSQSSGFGRRRRPTRGASNRHYAVDMRAPTQTPVIASANGCVRRVLTNRRRGYGLSVYLDHGNGYETQYSHLNRIQSRAMRLGQCFQRGDIIGYSGRTGVSTGPHLHFAVHRNGRPVNPTSLMLEGTRANSRSCNNPPSYASVDSAMEQALQGRRSAPSGRGRGRSRGVANR